MLPPWTLSLRGEVSQRRHAPGFLQKQQWRGAKSGRQFRQVGRNCPRDSRQADRRAGAGREGRGSWPRRGKAGAQSWSYSAQEELRWENRAKGREHQQSAETRGNLAARKFRHRGQEWSLASVRKRGRVPRGVGRLRAGEKMFRPNVRKFAEWGGRQIPRYARRDRQNARQAAVRA